MTDELMTTREVMEYLKISRTKLIQYKNEGLRPAHKLGNKPNSPLRYRRSDVDQWLEQHPAAEDTHAD